MDKVQPGIHRVPDCTEAYGKVCLKNKTERNRAREMVQWVTVLPGIIGSILRTYKGKEDTDS